MRLRDLFKRKPKPKPAVSVWDLLRERQSHEPLLTPLDIRNKEFTTHRLREGYDMDEVDDFLDHVRDTINRLAKTLETLQKETKK
jgi:DivIVA domain-containing protein